MRKYGSSTAASLICNATLSRNKGAEYIRRDLSAGTWYNGNSKRKDGANRGKRILFIEGLSGRREASYDG